MVTYQQKILKQDSPEALQAEANAWLKENTGAKIYAIIPYALINKEGEVFGYMETILYTIEV